LGGSRHGAGGAVHYLRPGNYRFRVLACNNDGVWNEEGSAIGFSVRPTFTRPGGFSRWRAWRYWLGGGGGLGGGGPQIPAGAGAVEQQHAIERDRARIAKDIHDDLGPG